MLSGVDVVSEIADALASAAEIYSPISPAAALLLVVVPMTSTVGMLTVVDMTRAWNAGRGGQGLLDCATWMRSQGTRMENQHPEVTAYLRERARIAGSAGRGKCKARTREQAQKAVRTRWENARKKKDELPP